MRKLLPVKAAVAMSKALAKMAPEFTESRLRSPFFIIGCGRSGTTLLDKTLASHLDIAVYPTEANELWHPQTYPWHQSTLEVPPMWADPYTFTKTSLESRTAQNDQQIRAVFGAYQFLARGKHFLNKSVMVTFMMPYVLRLVPESRFIHIVRDGRAVALSYLIKERSKLDNFDRYRRKGYDFEPEALLEKYAEHWQQHVLEIEKQKETLGLVKKGLLFEFHYEDFCAHPQEFLQRLAEFIGVAPDRFQVDDYLHIKNMNYKYQQELGSATIEKLTQIAAPALRVEGYL